MINFIDRDGIVHINFAAVSRKARLATDASIRFIIIDARQALNAFPDGPKAGYYADEISIYAGELKHRQLITR